MTSQESIGSCSLDVDQSASDRSENTVDSISKKTLHSLNLSCNGDSVSSPGNLTNGSSETLQKSHLSPDEKLNVSNGHRDSTEPEQLTVKKPSYLGLACSISGYSGINRYDSKLREGFRSRDSSPGTRLIDRDTSPAGFRSNEQLNVPAHPYPPKSQSISPLAMERQNGFSNGLKEECKLETYRESRSSISICQGYSEVDKGVMHSTFTEVSPIRPNTPTKRTPGASQILSCSQQNKSFSSRFSASSPKQVASNLSNASFSDTSILNGSNVEVESQALNNSSSSEKSFIQQRVERLYGPGALAQGFFYKRSTSRLNTSENSFNNSGNNNDATADNANTEESLKNLPVLRHLRPEFRAQLPVVSPRRPTDGSEQVLKPLQRVTPVSRKVEQKTKIPTASNLDGNIAESGAQKLNSSVTSIPDQQPAAPKVVLPVLEPSASSTNVAKQVQEAEKTVEEKNGHYFMKLLKQETDRLLSLAASAEAELASGDTVALPEEAAGKLRSAAGKARLLASQKMQQFEGLCQKNINQVPGEEFPTTNEDLAGFWDMVMLQVVQVNELFDQIEKLRNSQWQEVCSVSQTPPSSSKPSKRKIPSKENTGDIKPVKPSCRSSSHSVSDKRVRFETSTLYGSEESICETKRSSRSTEQLPLEARLCDDAFQVLTSSPNFQENEPRSMENDVECKDSNPFLSESPEDDFPINHCTSYVVNYVNTLNSDINAFRFEKSRHPFSNFFPRRDVFENDIVSKKRLSNVQVLFKKETDKTQSRNDEKVQEISERLTENIQRLIKEEKRNKFNFENYNSSHRRDLSVGKRKENGRTKAKSCSPVARNSSREVETGKCWRTRSRTPEKKPPRNDPIKSTVNQQKSRDKRNEEKVPVSQKNNLFLSPSRKGNAKNRGYSVTFLDEVEKPRKSISGVEKCTKSLKSKSTLLENSKKKLPRSSNEKSPKKENLSKNVSKTNQNLSVSSETWSNIDSIENRHKPYKRVDMPEENCTFRGTWSVKKLNQIKEPSKTGKEDRSTSSETFDSVGWRLSDSKPFIPLSPETLRQLRQVYNAENQSHNSAVANGSEKLARMKVYEKKRKHVMKIHEEEFSKKLVSRGTDSPEKEINVQDIKSLNLCDETTAMSDTGDLLNENQDFSVQCFLPSDCRALCNEHTSTLVINNITNNITNWSEKKTEMENFLSSLMSSLSAEIVRSAGISRNEDSKVKNRTSIKKLSYDLIAEKINSSKVNASLVMDISQHVRSDFTVPLRGRKNVGSMDFDKYLPLKRKMNVVRYLEDLKYMQLFPENVEVPSDSKTPPVKMKHVCAFLKSNRNLCRLSLYLYMYGILSLVLLFLKMKSGHLGLLDPRVLYNL